MKKTIIMIVFAVAFLSGCGDTVNDRLKGMAMAQEYDGMDYRSAENNELRNKIHNNFYKLGGDIAVFQNDTEWGIRTWLAFKESAKANPDCTMYHDTFDWDMKTYFSDPEIKKKAKEIRRAE